MGAFSPALVRANRPSASRITDAIRAAIGSFSFQSLMASYPTAEKWLWEAGNLTDEKVAWRKNLLLQSQDFGVAPWSPAGAATANAIAAPDGTMTADLLDQATSAFQSQSITIPRIGVPVTVSFWMKGGTAKTVRLVVTGLAANPTIDTTPTAEWQRVSLTFTPTATSGIVYIQYSDTYLPGKGGTVYLWGAQLEYGSTATDYQRITDFNTEFLAAYPQHTLFQDITGRTPATKMEDPIALVIDTKAGYSPGPELLTNGDFNDGATGWTLGTDWTISGGVASRTASAGSSSLRSNIAVVPNRTFEVRITGTVSAGTLIFFGPDAPVSLAVGTYVDHRILLHFPVGAGGFIEATASGASTVVSIDKMSIRQLPGYHLIQSTAANRMKVTSRVNRLLYTEQFTNAAWSVTAGASIANNSDGSGTLTTNGAGTETIFSQSSSGFAIGQTLTATIEIRAVSYTGDINVDLQEANSPFPSSTVTITPNGEWQKVTITRTLTVTTSGIILRLRKGTATVGGSLQIRYPQVEFGNTATRYQRVVTATDYDYVGFPRLIEHDGLDDFGVTSRTVDLTGTNKVSVFAAVEKLSDAAEGMFIESSPNYDTNSGAFGIQAPGGISAARDSAFVGVSKGTIKTFSGPAAALFPAPSAHVVVLLNDIPGDSTKLRVNGAQVSQSTADQGTGNFGNHSIFVGRRGGTTSPFRGRWSVIGGVGALINDGQMASLERTLARTQGRTL